VVFPVCQDSEKSTTVRPCSDLRRRNKISPPISATTPSIQEATLQLRGFLDFKKDHEVRQFDLAKAFYKIAVRDPVTLKVGNSFFVSDRLVFGLSCGPAALNASQQILLCILSQLIYIKWPSWTRKFRVIIVMDDYLLIGPQHILDTIEPLLDQLWNMTGFDSPSDKRHLWGQTPVRWLGAHFAIQGETLVIQRPIRSLTISTNQLSKRKVFEYAGQLTNFTSCIAEIRSRLHCDAARMLAGSWIFGR
jgi:hypothetical protein